MSAEERVLEVLVGKNASAATLESYRKRLRAGDLDNNQIEISVQDSPQMPSFEIPGMQGGVGMVSIGDIFGKGMGKKKKKKMTVKESYDYLIEEESDKLIDQDQILKEAKFAAENNGIVFLDEIDKVSARSDGRVGADVSREGVQRDLLPLIEGTTVNTKHGPIKTDHILFIASGAFQLAKPSDLLPELQGRLPIRVELKALTKEDFIKILKEPDNSLIKQYKALLKTEDVHLNFTDDAIDAIAEISTHINSTIENIGARRLHTILERILDDISFNAPDKAGEEIKIDKKYVDDHLGDIAKDKDLSKFIL
jgi:ATP-dependent HslUV protease ATP-binding subunit HslU